MSDKFIKNRNKIIGILLIIFLTYVTILTSLYKMTGRWEWTIVNSKALNELVLFTAIFAVAAIIVTRFKKNT
jgi:hypothetical protein